MAKKKYNFNEGLMKHWDSLIDLGRTCNCPTCRGHSKEKEEYMESKGK